MMKMLWTEFKLLENKKVDGAKKELQEKLFDEGKRGAGKRFLQGREKHRS